MYDDQAFSIYGVCVHLVLVDIFVYEINAILKSWNGILILLCCAIKYSFLLSWFPSLIGLQGFPCFPWSDAVI